MSVAVIAIAACALFLASLGVQVWLTLMICRDVRRWRMEVKRGKL
jgi:hypothetical protein